MAGCGSSAPSSTTTTSLASTTARASSTTSARPPTTADTSSAPAIGPPFTLGVASGDPLADRVMLWTRLAPAAAEPGGGMPAQDVDVQWEVAADEAFTEPVADGVVVAETDHAHAVHVDAQGLEPGQWYWYRFRVGEHTSPVGRARTAPGDDASGFAFALTTCQDPQFGEYGVWADVAVDPDIESVVFTGDYIYELPPLDFSPSADGRRMWRSPSPGDLDGFRDRYAQVKEDPALQAAHAWVPWWVMWDDHEITDNYWREGPGQLDSAGGGFEQRRRAAYQAWWEHQPVRLPAPVDGRLDVHREAPMGALGSMFLIDTRQHADVPPCRDSSQFDVGEACSAADDAQRTLLGTEQAGWLLDRLAGVDDGWTALVSPVMFAGLDARTAAEGGDRPVRYLESWDGYRAERNQIADALARAASPIVLSGDYHAAFVLDVGPGFDAEAVCAEFMATAVSSSPFAADVRDRNPHVRHFDPTNGYTVCSVTADRWQTEFRAVVDVWDPATVVEPVARFEVGAGERTARAV